MCTTVKFLSSSIEDSEKRLNISCSEYVSAIFTESRIKNRKKINMGCTTCTHCNTKVSGTIEGNYYMWSLEMYNGMKWHIQATECRVV